MCPTVVKDGDKTVLGVGGAGGVIIPNAVCSFLAARVFEKASLAQSLAAPRLHTVGTLEAIASGAWPPADIDYLNQAGFKARTGTSAH